MGDRAMRMPGRAAVCLMVMVMTMTASVSPMAAQNASPEVSPAASPVGTEDGAAWRVVNERRLAIDGEPVTLSPDGRWVAGSGPEQEFCVWEVATLDAVC